MWIGRAVIVILEPGVEHEVGLVSQAQSIGSLARRVVMQTGFEGRILARLREAVYIRGSGGLLIWLALPNHLPHRRAILAGFDPSAAAVGSAVSASGSCLVIDGLPAIDISEAACWSPPRDGAGEAPDLGCTP